jgi:hypothetical protein
VEKAAWRGEREGECGADFPFVMLPTYPPLLDASVKLAMPSALLWTLRSSQSKSSDAGGASRENFGLVFAVCEDGGYLTTFGFVVRETLAVELRAE